MPDSNSRALLRRLPVTSDAGSPPIRVIRADLRCLLCTRALGVLEAQGWPTSDPVLFRPRSGVSAVQVAEWWNLRCLTCGGNAYPDEVDEVPVQPIFSRDDGKARRGRPPRRLVEQRQAARGASAF
jgi:hypothetical protein